MQREVGDMIPSQIAGGIYSTWACGLTPRPLFSIPGYIPGEELSIFLRDDASGAYIFGVTKNHNVHFL